MINLNTKLISDNPVARWTVLIAVSLTMMCGYFLTDAIAPLKTLLENELSWDSLDFGIVNSGYGWLNVNLLLLIVGGVILDKKGARFTGIMSVFVMLVGAFIKFYAVGIMTPSPDTILGIKTQVLTAAIGYSIFAFGYETLGVTGTKIIVRWFSGKEIALALGMQVAFARIGTMAAMGAPLRIYEWTQNIGTPLLFGLVLLCIGFLVFMVFVLMDKRLDREKMKIGLADDEKFILNDILSIIKLKGFWYIAVLCLLFYISIMTFQKFGVEFISTKFGLSQITSGDLLMLLPIGALFLTPLFGGIYDTRGKGATMMIIGSLMIVVVYALFSVSWINQPAMAIAIVVLLGISFSLVPSAMWPAVAKIIPLNKLGTAYALIFWVQNIGLAYAPLFIGFILDSYCKTTTETGVIYDYTLPMQIFMVLGVLATILALILKRESRIKGYKLEEANIKN